MCVILYLTSSRMCFHYNAYILTHPSVHPYHTHTCEPVYGRGMRVLFGGMHACTHIVSPHADLGRSHREGPAHAGICCLRSVCCVAMAYGVGGLLERLIAHQMSPSLHTYL